MSRTNKTRHTEWHKTCKCKCRLHVTINKDGMKTNADVNVKNYLFGILVIVSVINYVMLENI